MIFLSLIYDIMFKNLYSYSHREFHYVAQRAAVLDASITKHTTTSDVDDNINNYQWIVNR